MRPKGKEKKDMRKNGEVNFNNMTITPFRITIVSKGVGGSGEVKDTLGGKKFCKRLVFTSIIGVEKIKLILIRKTSKREREDG